MKFRKIISIYLSGFLVGVALVLYPAAGNIFTDTDYHGFSSGQFGSIFTPQIILALLASLGATKIAKAVGMKKVLLFGLISLFTSMLFMTLSHWSEGDNLTSYILIMTGTAFLGAGFGFTITALNPFAYTLFPGKETSAVTAMHIMLGLGTASSAMILNVFHNSGMWWVAPALVGIIVLLMVFFVLPLDLSLPESNEEESAGKKKTPARIWLYALVVFLYGACEATFGSWGSLFLEKAGGLTIAKASLGLSLFWGSITIGRLIFTFIALRFSTKWLYVVATFLVALVFFMLPRATSEATLLSCMILGGLGMSFLFPISISNSTNEFPKYATLISGVMVASIQLGTGLSANVIGSLNNHFTLSSLFQFSAVYALLMGLIVFYLMKTKKTV